MTASTIALINSFVAGAGITLVVNELLRGMHLGIAISAGIASLFLFLSVFLAYQRWRFSILDQASSATSTIQPGEPALKGEGK
jgi:hypothetical protein